MPLLFMADIIKSICRFLPVLPLPFTLFFLLCIPSLHTHSSSFHPERWLFFLIAILIIINQLTAGHERGPLSVLSFPFCILHSLTLSPILNHRLLSLSHYTFPIICLLHCFFLQELFLSLLIPLYSPHTASCSRSRVL